MLRFEEPGADFERAFEEGAASEDHPLVARWKRARALGVERRSEAHPLGTSDDQLRDRQLRLAETFRDEHGWLDQLSQQLAAHSLAAMIADRDGILLTSHRSDDFMSEATRSRIVPGADWSESARGTNAVGTAIVEGRPVAVIGRAHYEQRNRGLFCYAAPVHDAHGELCAVIDVSGPLDRHDAFVGAAVEMAAAAAERAVSAMAYARVGLGNLSAIERLLARARSPAMLVEARGPIRFRNELALADILQCDGALDCRRLFGIDFKELASLASRGSELHFEAHGRRWKVAMDPLLDVDARAVAVIVHFERTAGQSSPPARRHRGAAPELATNSRPAAEPRRQRSPVVPPLHPAFDEIFAEDPAAVAAKVTAWRFAPTPMPVLLLAETGTGKELFARAIARSSAAASGPFVAINCSALSASLLESELFGYAPGAFTGSAKQGSLGLIGAADGGVLFLDEIAEMPEAMQAALLRVLDHGTYLRVGDPRPQRSSFRLIAATCRDLAKMVEERSFRRDLFYRVSGAVVRIPALRDRHDRGALARALLRQVCPRALELGPTAASYIESHDWPGNVRELKVAMQHAAAMCGDDAIIEREHLPEPLLGSGRAGAGAGGGGGVKPRDVVLQEAAEQAMLASSGNVSEAARRMGVARDTLYRMLRRR